METEKMLESLKKITKSTKISDYEVLTDGGFVSVEMLHETIEYDVYNLKLVDGKEIKCADNHIVFTKEVVDPSFSGLVLKEIFVKNLSKGSIIMTSDDNGNLIESEVLEVVNLGYKEVMYDLELVKGSNHRYFTNGILSHNTHLAKQLAKEIFGSEDSLIRIDMSEYQEKHNMSRLIGSPPGYVGYDQGGQLTEAVKNKPYSVILFDEIEKANKDIFSLLLQMMDDGHLTDSFGRKINFKNTLIIMTSNLGVKKVQDFGTGVGFETTTKVSSNEDMKKSLLQKELKNHFTPEFLNRVDEVIIFNQLKEVEVAQIVDIELLKLSTRLTSMGYDIEFTTETKEFIGKVGYDEKYGARPIKRAIQEKLEDLISEEVLRGIIKENVKYQVVLKDEKLVIEERN